MPMETNLKTWQRVVIGLGLPSLICLVFLYMWSGIYGLRCFFYELTDLYCPGCGSSRALSSLLHGDWKGAFTHNVLVLPLGVPATAVFLHEYLRLVFPALRLKPVCVPQKLAAGCCVLIFVFWFLRNLPAFAFLAP